MASLADVTVAGSVCGVWFQRLTVTLMAPTAVLGSSQSVCVCLHCRFNMPHDDNPKCREAGMKPQYHIMAPTLNYNTNPWSWSKCSRKYITEFLE